LTVCPLQLNIPVVDAWTAMEGNTPSRGDYLSDGLHLNIKYVANSPHLISSFHRFAMSSMLCA
jgi:hypothetical protein